MKNLETIEEASEKEFPLIDTEWCRTGAAEEENLQLLGHRKSFIKGAKWQQERSYSEKEVIDILVEFSADIKKVWNITKWFEQYKKK